MKENEVNFILKFQTQFSQLVRTLFPLVPFDESHPPEKFIGLIKVSGQKPIALFTTPDKPKYCKEMILEN
ncbi:MAG: hypothetical protein Q7K65_00850 [Candidatus Buchananbacteria bacterium]|nr:hypothetical protein [Candidatus Buchananbacteria bacterium]